MRLKDRFQRKNLSIYFTQTIVTQWSATGEIGNLPCKSTAAMPEAGVQQMLLLQGAAWLFTFFCAGGEWEDKEMRFFLFF